MPYRLNIQQVASATAVFWCHSFSKTCWLSVRYNTLEVRHRFWSFFNVHCLFACGMTLILPFISCLLVWKWNARNWPAIKLRCRDTMSWWVSLTAHAVINRFVMRRKRNRGEEDQKQWATLFLILFFKIFSVLWNVIRAEHRDAQAGKKPLYENPSIHFLYRPLYENVEKKFLIPTAQRNVKQDQHEFLF